MNILVVMIPLSILLLIGAGVAFFWAVEHDQFDDLDTPKLLPLLDDPTSKEIGPKESETQKDEPKDSP
jgi:cbb3-type cytochrome oxidase maturation protein